MKKRIKLFEQFLRESEEMQDRTDFTDEMVAEYKEMIEDGTSHEDAVANLCSKHNADVDEIETTLREGGVDLPPSEPAEMNEGKFKEIDSIAQECDTKEEFLSKVKAYLAGNAADPKVADNAEELENLAAPYFNEDGTKKD